MTGIDLAAIGVYALLVVGIGVLSARRGGSGELLLAGRNLPTVVVLASMVATELSAATFLGVPHAAYSGTWSYLQFAFGALAAKALLARYVIPLYHRLGIVTVYGLLETRYGPRSRRAAALCFTVGRILASGVRLFIAALAFSAVTGWPIEAAIALCGVLAGIYTSIGGLRSVVWTDLLQACVFLVGAAALLVALVSSVEGGASALYEWARENGRTQIFGVSPFFSLSDTRALGVALFGGFFLTLATHATDHDMVQRLLATRDGRAGGRALMGSAWLNFPITLLFLAIGTGLAHFYTTAPAYSLGEPGQVVPVFALNELPSGVRGLIFAGLFAAAMSSLDSAICAIAAAWVVDVAPQPGADEDRERRRVRRVSATVCTLLMAAAIGMAAYHRALSSAGGEGAGPSLVEFALSAMTILYGGLLGVFALGVVSRKRLGEAAALGGLAAGAAVGVALFLHPVWLGRSVVAWPWWVPLGASAALATALLLARRSGDLAPQEPQRVSASSSGSSPR